VVLLFIFIIIWAADGRVKIWICLLSCCFHHTTLERFLKCLVHLDVQIFIVCMEMQLSILLNCQKKCWFYDSIIGNPFVIVLNREVLDIAAW